MVDVWVLFPAVQFPVYGVRWFLLSVWPLSILTEQAYIDQLIRIPHRLVILDSSDESTDSWKIIWYAFPASLDYIIVILNSRRNLLGPTEHGNSRELNPILE